MHEAQQAKDKQYLIGMTQFIPSDGFVRFLDSMGTEKDIVDAARISYGKGTKMVSDDVLLLRYLMRHTHTSPYEMCEMKFHLRLPMDVWRQMVRHRTANVNEYSTRYSEAIDSVKTTGRGRWRLQAKNNKQGSAGFITDFDISDALSDDEVKLHEHIQQVYQARLAHGVAKEQARKDLSLSNYTEVIWKCDLHNLLHFANLRLDEHAQLEIREYAQAMYYFIQNIYPNVAKAFEDYKLNAYTMSAMELEVLREFLSLGGLGTLHKILDAKLGVTMTKREVDEFVRAIGAK